MTVYWVWTSNNTRMHTLTHMHTHTHIHLPHTRTPTHPHAHPHNTHSPPHTHTHTLTHTDLCDYQSLSTVNSQIGGKKENSQANIWGEGRGPEREEGGRRGRKLVGDNNHQVNDFVCLQLLTSYTSVLDVPSLLCKLKN